MHAHDLLEALILSGWRPTVEVNTVFGSLAGSEVTDASAVAVVADLVKRLWTGPYFSSQRQLGLTTALDALASARYVRSVLPSLRNQIRRRLFLLPDAHTDQVFAMLQIWEQSKT